MITPRPIPPLTASDIARFWAKVDKNGPVPEHMPHLGQCWVWTAGIATMGYGKFHIAGHCYLAHRAAWTLQKGPLRAGMLIMHLCDNRRCQRLSHIQEGTSIDNVTDMVQKGRSATGLLNGAYTRPDRVLRGSNHGSAKLTEMDVAEVRRLFSSREMDVAELAVVFQITRQNVKLIVRRQTWKHVVP